MPLHTRLSWQLGKFSAFESYFKNHLLCEAFSPSYYWESFSNAAMETQIHAYNNTY